VQNRNAKKESNRNKNFLNADFIHGDILLHFFYCASKENFCAEKKEAEFFSGNSVRKKSGTILIEIENELD
jgi:hypothetical protein